MISIKGKHYPKDVILFTVFFYVRYAVSYHDLEEIMQERGVDVDYATLNLNLLLFFLGFWPLIEILQVKYLNNIIEQDHRFIKKINKPMKGFKAFHSAAATLQGIEVAHMIRKNQFEQNGLSPSGNSLPLLNNCVQT